MKWLEIIKLRSTVIDSRVLEELFSTVQKLSQDGLVEISIYHHAGLETDLSLHLHWESGRLEQNGSAPGLRLARALKEFGLIDHSVWIKKER